MIGTSLSSAAAGRLYDSSLPAIRPLEPVSAPISAPSEAAPSFAETLETVADGAVDTLFAGERTAEAMMAGKADAHSVVEALAATEMALEMAVAVRDKVVAAYQEILRMPV